MSRESIKSELRKRYDAGSVRGEDMSIEERVVNVICEYIKQELGDIQAENKALKAKFAKLRWIPVSEIPREMKGQVEFINPDMKDGGIGGICLGTTGNIKYIKQNYTHWREIDLPESEG